MVYRSIDDSSLDRSDYVFNYQESLTNRLDRINTDFDQSTIDQIVLWKTNRYVELDDETLCLLNKIANSNDTIDINTTKDLLKKMLGTKGIRLPMASTILRFKNPNVYQIIDQRSYRVLYKQQLSIPNDPEAQISLYLNYLEDLRSLCKNEEIDFREADRVLYWADKQLNKGIPIKY